MSNFEDDDNELNCVHFFIRRKLTRNQETPPLNPNNAMQSRS